MGLTLSALTGVSARSQELIVPALLSGQSNACLLAPHLPVGSHVLVGEWGRAINQWDWTDPTVDGALGRQFLEALQKHRFSTLIWWQGESDSGRTAEYYYDRLVTVLRTANLPTMIVEIASRPGREMITAMHRRLATHPSVAFIPTSDLPRLTIDGVLTDHFTSAAYDVVAQRLYACYLSRGWLTQ